MTIVTEPTAGERRIHLDPHNYRHRYDANYLTAAGQIPREPEALWSEINVVHIEQPHPAETWVHVRVDFHRPFLWQGDDAQRLNHRYWGAQEINAINGRWGKANLKEVSRAERIYYPDGYPANKSRHKAAVGTATWTPKPRTLLQGQHRNIWVATSIEIDEGSGRGGGRWQMPICRQLGRVRVHWWFEAACPASEPLTTTPPWTG